MDDQVNTGFLINPVLKKVSDDVNEYPLDVNNQRTDGPFPSGLPQATMPNPTYSETYRVLNEEQCPVSPGVFYNDEQSGWATKNDCSEGNYSTPVLYVVPAGTYSGSSKENANILATNDVLLHKQSNANSLGPCIPDGEFGNEYQSQTFTKNDCAEGETGSPVLYEVPANTFFAATLSEANDLALADIAANGQSNANTEGTCSSDPPVTCIGYGLSPVGGAFSIEYIDCHGEFASLTTSVPIGICTDGSGYNITSGSASESYSGPC